MNKRLEWFQCYPSKLLGALAGLKPDAKLVYMIFLLRIYEVRGPCTDTIESLATRIGINKRRVLEALDVLFKAGKLVRDGAGIHNPVAIQVLTRGEALHEERVAAGREGGSRSAKKAQQKQTTPPSRAAAELDRLRVREREKKEVKVEDSLFPDGNGSASPTPDLPKVSDWPDDHREQFWARYPRQTEKKAAMAKLEVIRKAGKVTWAILIAGVDRYAAHVSGTEERFIKHPTRWLNAGCWDDRFAGPRAPDRPPPRGPVNGFAAMVRKRLNQTEDDDARDGENTDGGRTLSTFINH